LLTTQYLEEADQLADDILVMDDGQMIAQGTADELKAKVGGERVEITLEDAADIETARGLLSPLAAGEVVVRPQARQLVAPVSGGTTVMRQVLAALDDAGLDIVDFGLRRPTLDDAFLTLTGRPAADDTPVDASSATADPEQATR
jgi:ABC-2 type transport system ATP-binding protein